MDADCYICEEGFMHFEHKDEQEKSVLISSEVLTDNRELWTEVPENHFIMVEEDLKVRLKRLD